MINQHNAEQQLGKRTFAKDLTNLQLPTNNLEDVKKQKVSHRTSSLYQSQDEFPKDKRRETKEQQKMEVEDIEENQINKFNQQIEKMKEKLAEEDRVQLKDIQRVGMYSQDITEYLITTQDNYRIDPLYMENKQVDINEKMRCILVDWLVDVQVKFKLYDETLHMTTSLIDRYLQLHPVRRQQLQLVGVTCMFIASKYEEIYAPELKDIVYVTDNAYDQQQILDMEGTILKALDFKLCSVSNLVFYKRLQQFWGQHLNKMDYLARYLLDLLQMELKFHKYSPLVQASAAIYLVQKLFKTPAPTWSVQLQQVTSLNEHQIRPCAKELCIMLQSLETNNTTQTAIKRKFQHSRYLSISNIRIERTK